jgi:hypothetical protein
MDLASPSPPPEQEQCIIGAWTDFSSSSSETEPIATPPDHEIPIASEVNEAAEMPPVDVATTAVEHEESHEVEPVIMHGDPPSSSPAASNKGKEKEQVGVDPSLFVTRAEYEELKTKYTDLQVRVVQPSSLMHC